MGLYDSVHTGDRCGQVKCLGKNVSNIVPGDHRVLHVIPQGQRAEELRGALRAFIASGAKENDPASPLWLLFNGEVSTITSWQIKTRFGFIKFTDGVFTSWNDAPSPGLPIVDNYGAPLNDTGPGVNDTTSNLAWEEWGSLSECSICYQLSHGVTPRAWRQAQAEKRQAQRQAYEAAEAHQGTARIADGIADALEAERRAAYARVEERVARVRRQLGY